MLLIYEFDWLIDLLKIYCHDIVLYFILWAHNLIQYQNLPNWNLHLSFNSVISEQMDIRKDKFITLCICSLDKMSVKWNIFQMITTGTYSLDICESFNTKWTPCSPMIIKYHSHLLLLGYFVGTYSSGVRLDSIGWLYIKNDGSTVTLLQTTCKRFEAPHTYAGTMNT